jgi:ribonucleoside-diphosphate reductase alpha chain
MTKMKKGTAPPGLETPAITDNALTVLKRRYLAKDAEGNPVETSKDMFWRVADFIARADKTYDDKANTEALARKFYTMMAQFDFLPNSPTLMNAGRELGQLSACFVLPIRDSMESIFTTLKHAALIHKSGGGTGFSFSNIRPHNDMVLSTKGISSGPISFMKVYDAATETIKQGGTRRGANMAILNVDHPDIMEFITVKSVRGQLHNFNLSVGMTAAFMEAAKGDKPYALINPRSGEAVRQLNASEVFDQIIHHAWAGGEPGIVFLDKMNSDNPTPALGRIESTNPCGEQPLLPYESCNLGSINLSRMTRDGTINWDKLRETVHLSVHFLDNVIDMNRYPLEEIETMTRGNRKIGLGVMGFADLLINLGIPYNSRDALEKASELMAFIDTEALNASRELAKKRGPFPNAKQSIYADDPAPPRNATRTTIAPTGTISIIAGCSSGIEPLFALCFTRNVMDDDKLMEVNPVFKETMEREGKAGETLFNEVLETGSIQAISSVPDKIKHIFITAHDVTPEDHVRIQAAFQKFTNNAVSKTVNFPSDATEEDVRQVYMLAWELGCKGVTIYRDGSREGQVLTQGKEPYMEAEEEDRIKRQRPPVLTGRTYQMTTGCGALYVTINEDEKGIFELFNTMGKAGGCAASQSEAIGRLVSLAWRSGIPADPVIKQLIGISCHKPAGFGDNKILSCADAIAKAVRLHTYGKLSEEDTHANGKTGACPECGGTVEHEGGCMVCRSCGYSECS